MNTQSRFNITQYSFLNHIINTLDNRIEINAELDIEVNSVPLHLLAHGDSATISFRRIADIPKLLKILKSRHGFDKEKLKSLREVLQKTDITIYLHNKLLGIAGPKAGFFFPRIVSLLTR